MAWDASGRWIPDDVQRQALSVTNTAGGGLLGGMAQNVFGAMLRQRQQQTGGVQTNPALPPQPLPATTPPAATPALLPPIAQGPPVQPPASPAVPSGVPAVTGNPGADPVMEDASVSGRLNGLLAENSLYTQMAREGGVRTAGRRGLLNSSIAAGSGQAAAIAAAAPIASQEAQQVSERNNMRLQSSLQYRSATALQAQGDAAAWGRQMSAQAHAGQLQGTDIAAAWQRLGFEATTQRDIAHLNASTQLTTAQMQANSNLIGNYLQAFGQLASNPDVPASARNAYITEFQRVLSSSGGLATTVGGATINWGSGTPAPSGGSSAPYSLAQIAAMKDDGVKGNMKAALAKLNTWRQSEGLPALTEQQILSGVR